MDDSIRDPDYAPSSCPGSSPEGQAVNEKEIYESLDKATVGKSDGSSNEAVVKELRHDRSSAARIQRTRDKHKFKGITCSCRR